MACKRNHPPHRWNPCIRVGCRDRLNERLFGRPPDRAWGQGILWDVDEQATLFIDPDAAAGGVLAGLPSPLSDSTHFWSVRPCSRRHLASPRQPILFRVCSADRRLGRLLAAIRCAA